LEVFQRLAIVQQDDVPNYFEKMSNISYGYLSLSQQDEKPFDTTAYLLDRNHEINFDQAALKLNTLLQAANLDMTPERKADALIQIYEGMNQLCYFREFEGVVYEENGNKTINPGYLEIQSFLNDPVAYIQKKNIQLSDDEVDKLKDYVRDSLVLPSRNDEKVYERNLIQSVKDIEREFNNEITPLSRQISDLEKKIKKGGRDKEANEQQLLTAQKEIEKLTIEHAKGLKNDVLSGKITQSYFEKRMEQLKSFKPTKEKDLPPLFEIDKFPKDINKWFAKSKYKDEELSQKEKEQLYLSEKAKADTEKQFLIRCGVYTASANANNAELFNGRRADINFKVDVSPIILKLADEENFSKHLDKKPVKVEKGEVKIDNNELQKDNKGERISINLDDNKNLNKTNVIKSNEKEIKIEKERKV